MKIAAATKSSPLHEDNFSEFDIAVIVPCYNEEMAITNVVEDFKRALPSAKIYVYDNNSNDRTIEKAQEAGAIVRHEPRQGKGHVVRRMFSDIEADIYLMVDGDDTYDASAAPLLVSLMVEQGVDMVNGARREVAKEAYRLGHRTGNKMLTGLVKLVFGAELKDMLSGYRVFSRRFVKSFPMMSSGFEIETELTIHALELELPVAEVYTDYSERGENSESKLNTISDGIRILKTILMILKQERPMTVFGLAALFCFFIAAIALIPVLANYFETGLVVRLPTFLTACGVILLGMLSLVCGLILSTVTRGRQEAKRMQYLMLESPHSIAENKSKL